MYKEKILSIIIPAYNCEKYICQCLKSIISYKNIEIIVINDGSTDNTKEILEKYDKIKFYNNENYGVSYTRNFGIKEATGKYIMFIDSDDYLVKDSLLPILKDNYNEDVIYLSHDLKVNNKNDLYMHIVGKLKPCIAGPYCKMYKREFLIKNKIKFKDDLINGEDMLFNVECVNKLKNYKIVDSKIYMYRQNASGVTKNFNSKIVSSDINFQKYLNEAIIDLDTKVKKEIIDFNSVSSVLTLTDRISHIKEYSEFKKYMSVLNQTPYVNYLNINIESIGIKNRLILFLIKRKKYRIIYFLYSLKHKRKISNDNKEIFIEM